MYIYILDICILLLLLYHHQDPMEKIIFIVCVRSFVRSPQDKKDMFLIMNNYLFTQTVSFSTDNMFTFMI